MVMEPASVELKLNCKMLIMVRVNAIDAGDGTICLGKRFFPRISGNRIRLKKFGVKVNGR